MTPPHDHQHVVGHYHLGQESHVKNAIKAALEARKKWSQMPWEQRAAIFLRAAELVAVSLPSKNQCRNNDCPIKNHTSSRN